MKPRIGFFQYELSHPNNAPHVGMCLLLDDLRKSGFPVDAALVHAGAVDGLIARIRERRYDLVGLDSIFTLPIVTRIKQACPGVRILLGGTNALALFLAAPADYAVAGAGRAAMKALAQALASGESLAQVPNLYFRAKDGTIDQTGVRHDWSLAADLDPFDPDLDWEYIGPERSRQANTRFASVVPEFGCAFQADALSGRYYDRLAPGRPSAVLDGLRLTDRARAALQPYLDNTRGCAFCTFRFQEYTIDATGPTVERTISQMRRLGERYGIREFSVQSEHPFRFLSPLMRRIHAERLPVETLLVRTFPAILARNAALVERSIEDAVAAGVRIQLQQLGFENFVQDELDHLGKGVSVAENVAAARLLFRLRERFGAAVEVFRGHGFILFTPWTRPEDVVENVRVIREEAPFLAGSIGLASRLCFYDPFNPIYRLAEAEGLAVRSPRDYGLDFRFADARTDRMCRLARALEGDFLRKEAAPESALSRAVLTAAAPLFVDSPDAPNDALFRQAEGAARENLRRDRDLWPSAEEVHRVQGA
jgi:radical SAM superfamily enzyme YgiQ (UPF0313 family)